MSELTNVEKRFFMLELFSRCQASSYFYKKRDDLNAKIKALSDEKIINTDFEELVNFYFDEYKTEPITLFLEKITKDISKEKIKPPDKSYRISTYEYESGRYDIDGVKITFTIPFHATDTDLLYLTPSKWFSSKFLVDDIRYNEEVLNYCLYYSISHTVQELQGKDSDYIDKQFNQNFKYYIDTITNLNKDIDQYNSTLSGCIRHNLEARKKNADDFIAIGKMFDIPLKQNPNAPNTTPIVLKKTVVKKAIMPEMKKPEEECQLLSNDYNYIKSILQILGFSMGKAARTFSKLDEEELRDIIIAFLNCYYLPTATAETFSRKGKTDIHILFENKSAYIAECKIWHGEKHLLEAIEQLFSYTTWRDIKTSLIIFNKKNTDFPRLLNTIQDFLKRNPLCKNIEPVKKNEWLCDFIKDTEATSHIQVQIIVFDLCI